MNGWAFSGLSRYQRIMDDIVIYDTTHVDHVRLFLQRYKEQKITVNTWIWVFRQPTVFCRFPPLQRWLLDWLCHNSLHHSAAHSVTVFMGLVKPLSSSTNAIASLLVSFRLSLSTKNEFIWLSNPKSRPRYTSHILFWPAKMPPNRDLDSYANNTYAWHLIQAGSRFISDTETH